MIEFISRVVSDWKSESVWAAVSAAFRSWVTSQRSSSTSSEGPLLPIQDECVIRLPVASSNTAEIQNRYFQLTLTTPTSSVASLSSSSSLSADLNAPSVAAPVAPSVRVSSVPIFYFLAANLLAASPALNFRRPVSSSASTSSGISLPPPANTIDLYLHSKSMTLPALPDALATAAQLSSVGGLDSEIKKGLAHVRALFAPTAVRMRAQLCAPAPGNDQCDFILSR